MLFNKHNAQNEQARLISLHSYDIMDTGRDEDFDALASIASSICQVPIALITFIDKDRQWFKAHHGTDITENKRELSFCTHTINSPADVMMVPDATKDSRFATNPIVTNLNIQFYAGVSLVNEDGQAIGTMCVLDTSPHTLGDDQVQALKILAKQVVHKLELNRKVVQLEKARRQTERTLADFRMVNESLTEINYKFKLALEAGKLGSYEIDMETGQMSVTPFIQIHFGLEEDAEFNFDCFLKAIVPEQRGLIENEFIQSFSIDKPFNVEFEIAWPDGSGHWMSASGKATGSADGANKKIAGLMLDITERKARESDKDEFLAVVSHELKTPITSLKANIEILNYSISEGIETNLPKMLESSLRSVVKINQLVDDLLNMHRYSNDQLTLNKTSFSIAELFAVCCNHVRLTGNYELIFNGSAEIYADVDRIDQVIVNFVNNAVKYAPDSKQIYLHVSKEATCTRIAVTDAGPGIPEASQKHLFHKNWRANHSGKKYSGLGLGLYICSEIIKRHNGEIGVISSPGNGATFWFTIPHAS